MQSQNLTDFPAVNAQKRHYTQAHGGSEKQQDLNSASNALSLVS